MQHRGALFSGVRRFVWRIERTWLHAVTSLACHLDFVCNLFVTNACPRCKRRSRLPSWSTLSRWCVHVLQTYKTLVVPGTYSLLSSLSDQSPPLFTRKTFTSLSSLQTFCFKTNSQPPSQHNHNRPQQPTNNDFPPSNQPSPKPTLSQNASLGQTMRVPSPRLAMLGNRAKDRLREIQIPRQPRLRRLRSRTPARHEEEVEGGVWGFVWWWGGEYAGHACGEGEWDARGEGEGNDACFDAWG
ncbi:hypothetical protein BDY17DRAFT_174336 [Neohortaea acidophila]|uniref:Uncharacterized protein n=1 Tax=Neohortaea acidophila TaxID=245834 RepID=A0A6A6PQI2_9PEZI|nr:uncharacterized protein BDY17DRAFT_174336 [Neohortaea acidophila]KAF2481941.1 hypothetical protein BDY17DRAFT_174336 [Neohortaea acidophila]